MRSCQLFDRGGLGQTGRAFDQQMAISQQRDQQTVDQRLLTDDAGLQLITQRAERIQRLVQRLIAGWRNLM